MDAFFEIFGMYRVEPKQESTPMTEDERKLKSYVWHEGKGYFISTIERDSSCAHYPSRIYETLVWEYDWETSERGEWVGQYGGGCAFRQHMKACEDFYRNGKQMPDDE